MVRNDAGIVCSAFLCSMVLSSPLTQVVTVGSDLHLHCSDKRIDSFVICIWISLLK